MKQGPAAAKREELLASQALDDPTRAALEMVLDGQRRDVAGVRLFGVDGLSSFLASNGPIGSLAAQSLGETARPVRAILFDKSASANWSLTWHQDRVVAVRERMEVEGFGPWTRKHGRPFVRCRARKNQGRRCTGWSG
jgi:hypothetical protein